MFSILEKGNRLRVMLHVVVIAFSLIGILKRDKISSETTFFERVMIDSIGPIQSSIFYVRDLTKNFFSNYIFLVNVKKNSAELKKEISELENQIFQLQELKKENQRLKNLLKFGEEIGFERVLARVVGWDSNNAIKVLRINRGKEHGVKEKYPVISAKGLVGYVYRASNEYSDVITILHQDNRVDAIGVRTRSHGIVEGYSGGKCIMKYVTRSEPIALNDQVMTSGLGNIYPKGLKIGTISKIEKESYGITQFVEIKPSVDFRRIEEVIVLLPDKKKASIELSQVTKEPIKDESSEQKEKN